MNPDLPSSDSSARPTAPARPAPARILNVQPRVDIYEGQDDWLLLADLPGVEPGGVQVQAERDELRLTATGSALDGSTVQLRRAFQLARGTAVDQIRAELKDGVLTLTLPKAAEVRSRAVEVKVG